MRIRFNISIVTAILLITTAMTLATIGSVWWVSARTAEQTAGKMFDNITGIARERLDRLMGEVLVLASLGAAQTDMDGVTGNGLAAPSLPLLLTALGENSSLYSLYYGFENGDFLQVISAREDGIRKAHQSPAHARWIVRTITARESDGARRQSWTFLDENRNLVGQRMEDDPIYDPRKRGWYKSAMDSARAELSSPYLFNSLSQPGITASRTMPGARGVFGVDVTLTELSRFISNLDISKNGGVVLFDESSRVVAMTLRFGDHPALAKMGDIPARPVQAVEQYSQTDHAGGTQMVEVEGDKLLVQEMAWEKGGRRISIAAAAPVSDFVEHIYEMQNKILGLAFVVLCLFIPVSLIFSNRMSHSVVRLAEDADRVRHLDFTGAPPRPSRILEFHALSKAFTYMKADLSLRTHALEVAESKLSRLVTLGIAMSAEHHTDKLMEMVLLGAKEIANADGGTLYILDEKNQLQFQMIHNTSLGIAMGGTENDPPNLPPVQLYNDQGEPNFANVVSYCVHKAETVNIRDAYDPVDFDFSGTRMFDEKNNYRSKSFITVPLRPRGGDVIGALQLINAQEEGSDHVVPFTEDIQGFVEALASQAATAMDNRNLVEAQQKLMDSMIQLIAGAIDAKSPYTGGHCARVPELAIMLAEHASKVEDGPLGDFAFKTDEQWREFRIGAWLHDSGKVITPEYVVDKATKLESIFNRIHEIRTRFEVLLRDAQITRLETLVAGGDATEAEAAFERTKAELLSDFAFIAECNVGSEFMAPEAVERLGEIAKKTWQRHFDDRLGLSHGEMKRYNGTPPDALPATERLLDDKPHHIIPRDTGVHDMYDGLDFKLEIPEHLYNYGEMYNLSVTRGTLTREEHFKIVEHIMQTIAMLERMPFPKHLARVPEYAGTHHEALDGSGYPRKLTKDELSVPSRIMAIADIFEALTASDRPYKTPKTLSESVKILSFFRDDGHIDPDLFDLFLTSGAYKTYADRFLTPEQIDEVDIAAYVRMGATQPSTTELADA